jgi:hypothetical protein
MQDVGNLELLVGAAVAALFLVGLVWGPLYAIVRRGERRHAAEMAAEAAKPVDVTDDEARARFGRRFESDMDELARYLDPPEHLSRPGFRAVEPTGFGHMQSHLGTLSMAATAFLPAGSAALAAFGAADPQRIGGEIHC